jgi:hypothetical protein
MLKPIERRAFLLCAGACAAAQTNTRLSRENL